MCYAYDCAILCVVFLLFLFPSTIFLFAVGNDPFTFSASNSTVGVGGELDINATFSANPRPTVSLERQDGNAIPDEQNRVITTNINNDMSRLTFRDLREEDTGNYSVQVAIPGDVESQPISLTVVRGEFTSMFTTLMFCPLFCVFEYGDSTSYCNYK